MQPAPSSRHSISSSRDEEMVTELLGRRPQGDYEVVVRRAEGSPVVIANAPLLYSGRPMPTRYWLIDKALSKAIGTLESTGAVDEVENEIGYEVLAEVHDRYRAERDRLLPDDYDGHVPSGGVGGTRIGVKCLHAHYAYYLAGGDDPVGAWVHDRLAVKGQAFEQPDRNETDLASVAVIEIGSAMVKLLITDGHQRLLTKTHVPLAKASTDGVAVDGPTLDALAEALAEYRGIAQSAGVASMAVIATAAVRRSANRDALVDRITSAVGISLEVLDAETEAELALAGALVELGLTDTPVAVIDIGAASVEFAMTDLEGSGIDSWYSFPIGGSDVTSTYLLSDPPSPSELSAALSVIELYVTDLKREAPELAEALATRTVLGVGANQDIARVERGEADPTVSLSGQVISRDEAEELFRALATEERSDRRHNPGLPAHAVDDIVGAECLLLEVMRQLGIEAITISGGGVADGKAGELLSAKANRH